MLSATEQNSKIIKLELELAELRERFDQQNDPRLDKAVAAEASTSAAGNITQLIRNGDLSHSVNSWFESAPSGGDKDKEAANIYAHEPDKTVRVTDGQISIASPNTIKCLTSAPFAAGDVGKRIIIEAAGADGDNLSTTISGFVAANQISYTDASSLAANATNLTVRFGMKKLGRDNTKSSGSATNDALKSSDHTGYPAGISDPDWNRTNGIIRLGSRKVIDCPFGFYRYVPDDGAGNGTEFVPLHPLYAGRTVFARINLARASRFVKPKNIFFAIYNNHDEVLDFAHGAAFGLEGQSFGAPLATTAAKYVVVIETDQNYSIVSQTLTIADSPDEASFTEIAGNRITWKPFAGALRYKIYRQLGAGNVFLLEADSKSANYTDNNPATRIDTGSTSFPNPTNSKTGVAAYVATADGELDDLPIDGESEWSNAQAIIPFPATVNMQKFADPRLLIGLTVAAALEVADAVTNGTTHITSAVAQFTAAMNGNSFTLTDPANETNHLSGTITYVSATELVLSAAPGWSSVNNILEIADGAPHGILIDLIGAALLPGEWAHHPDDITGRPQATVSNPIQSTQGGVQGGGGQYGDEGGTTYYGGNYYQPGQFSY